MKYPIYLYNTMSREKELFKNISENNEVKIYSCGPTVYHYQHIGNMRYFVSADILNRTLSEAGYKIKHQINITDVGHNTDDGDNGEDKMEKGSKRENKSVWEISKYYTQVFIQDLNNLYIGKNILIEKENYNYEVKSDKFIWTRATDYILEQIKMIKTLEERGFTYKTSDGIYFDTSKFPKYSELAKSNIEGNEKGKRVSDELNEKKNKSDFALWKFSPRDEKRQMEWESPWGVGFPGWHIECSAMSRAILANHIDIHTGGIDHIPVHHTNEIAQSECSCDDEGRFVNYWMHVNFLNDTTGKMSKSKGDFLRLESLKEKNISPLAYRYLLLMTHYRKEMKFSWESLEATNTAYQKLLKNIEKLKSDLENEENYLENISELAKNYLKKFVKAMHDDLNTSIALATLWSVINDKNLKSYEKYNLIKAFDKYLGLGL